MATSKKKSSTRSSKPRGTNTNGADAGACAECERLKQALKRLMAARKEDQRAIAELERQRNAYQRAVLALIKNECKEEDWKDFRVEDYTIPFEDILAELEVKVKERASLRARIRPAESLPPKRSE